MQYFSADATNVQMHGMLGDISYTTATLPVFDAALKVKLQNNAFTSVEIDTILANFATAVISNGGTNDTSTLIINGTNAARTAASDAFKQTLIDSNYSVLVNE